MHVLFRIFPQLGCHHEGCAYQEDLPDQILKFLGSHVYSEDESGVSIKAVRCVVKVVISLRNRVQFNLKESHVEI